MARARILFPLCVLLVCSTSVDQGASAPTPTTTTGLVRVPHPSLSVLQGEQFWLHCSYVKGSNEADPAIWWKIGTDSTELPGGSKFFGTRGQVLDNNTLHVKNAQLNDSTNFTCTIFTTDQEYNFHSRVTVNAPTTRPPPATTPKTFSVVPTTPPIEGGPDAKPRDVRVIATGSTAINVSWVPVSSSRVGYRSEGFVVNYRKDGQGLATRSHNYDPQGTFLYINGLLPDTWYHVSVQAHNRKGDGPTSENVRIKTYHKGYEYETPTTQGSGNTRSGVDGQSTSSDRGSGNSEESKGGGSSQVVFIGIAAGAVVLAALVVLVAVYCYRKQKCELSQLQSSTIKKPYPSHSSRAEMISVASASPWHGPHDAHMITASIHMIDGRRVPHPAADSVSGYFQPGMGNMGAQTPMSQQSFPSVTDMQIKGSSVCSPRRKKLPRPGGVPPLDPVSLQASDNERPAPYGVDHFAYAGSADETPLSLSSPSGTLTRYSQDQTYDEVEGCQVFPPPPSHTPPPLDQCEGDYSEVEGGPSPLHHNQQWLGHNAQLVQTHCADNYFNHGDWIAPLPQQNGMVASYNVYQPRVDARNVHAV